MKGIEKTETNEKEDNSGATKGQEDLSRGNETETTRKKYGRKLEDGERTKDGVLKVLTFLEGEGFKLINDKSMPTYIFNNGTSAIDLTFARRIIARNQRQLWKSDGALLRKHLPIYTELEQQNVKEARPDQRHCLSAHYHSD